jgi:hypothetical protein
MINMV